MRVVLTGGGSMGHMVPFEPIVDVLRTMHKEKKKELPGWMDASKIDIYFLGVLDKEGEKFFKRLGVKTTYIPAGKLRRYPSPRTISDILARIPLGVLISLWHMWRLMPDVVISKGGYGSIPVSIASIFYRVPFLLHESDAVSGLANRMMASWASVVTVGLDQTRQNMASHQEKTIVTGTPVRGDLTKHEAEASKRAFNIAKQDKVLLVMGGSQGSEQINSTLLEVLASLVEDMVIIHITGEANFKRVSRLAKKKLKGSKYAQRYMPFGYLSDRMGQAMAAADLVVARAGATTLAELARLGKAAIVVPLDAAAQDHQRRNATVYEAAAAVRVIDPANLGRTLLAQNIRDVILDRSMARTLKANIKNFDYPDAARDIVSLAFKLAVGLVPRQPKQSKK